MPTDFVKFFEDAFNQDATSEQAATLGSIGDFQSQQPDISPLVKAYQDQIAGQKQDIQAAVDLSRRDPRNLVDKIQPVLNLLAYAVDRTSGNRARRGRAGTDLAAVRGSMKDRIAGKKSEQQSKLEQDLALIQTLGGLDQKSLDAAFKGFDVKNRQYGQAADLATGVRSRAAERAGTKTRAAIAGAELGPKPMTPDQQAEADAKVKFLKGEPLTAPEQAVVNRAYGISNEPAYKFVFERLDTIRKRVYDLYAPALKDALTPEERNQVMQAMELEIAKQFQSERDLMAASSGIPEAATSSSGQGMGDYNPADFLPAEETTATGGGSDILSKYFGPQDKSKVAQNQAVLKTALQGIDIGSFIKNSPGGKTLKYLIDVISQSNPNLSPLQRNFR